MEIPQSNDNVITNENTATPRKFKCKWPQPYVIAEKYTAVLLF